MDPYSTKCSGDPASTFVFGTLHTTRSAALASGSRYYLNWVIMFRSRFFRVISIRVFFRTMGICRHASRSDLRNISSNGFPSEMATTGAVASPALPSGAQNRSPATTCTRPVCGFCLQTIGSRIPIRRTEGSVLPDPSRTHLQWRFVRLSGDIFHTIEKPFSNRQSRLPAGSSDGLPKRKRARLYRTYGTHRSCPIS